MRSVFIDCSKDGSGRGFQELPGARHGLSTSAFDVNVCSRAAVTTRKRPDEDVGMGAAEPGFAAARTEPPATTDGGGNGWE